VVLIYWDVHTQLMHTRLLCNANYDRIRYGEYGKAFASESAVTYCLSATHKAFSYLYRLENTEISASSFSAASRNIDAD
jgi:hypothetical protein